MSKITFENKKGIVKVINKLSYPESINERVYNAISSGMFESFLPLSIIQNKKEIRIECTVQGLLPFSQYFNGIVTKTMFLDFVYEIIEMIQVCEKNMINANNIDLQTDKIFVDSYTKKVKCIFWPIVNNQRDTPPHVFLKQLPFSLYFSPYEKQDYLETYKAFFDGVTPFSVKSFKHLIIKLMGKTQTGTHRVPSEDLSSKAEYRNKLVQDKNTDFQKQKNIEYDPFAEEDNDSRKGNTEPHDNFYHGSDAIHVHDECTYCSSCGQENTSASNFCFRCGARLNMASSLEKKFSKEKRKNPGTVNLEQKTYGTVVLGGPDELDEVVYPTLKRIRTDEVFTIDKPSFRIGTERQYCDLFICDNCYISRSHADIITRGERYYIIDRNSTNRTFVDGRVIQAEKEVELFNGTKIRLANEDFTFGLE